MDWGLHSFGMMRVNGRAGRSKGEHLNSVSGRLRSGAVVELTTSARRSTAIDGQHS
jgi:hypothetical protein